jgi:hypothetical protein
VRGPFEVRDAMGARRVCDHALMHSMLSDSTQSVCISPDAIPVAVVPS